MLKFKPSDMNTTFYPLKLKEPEQTGHPKTISIAINHYAAFWLKMFLSLFITLFLLVKTNAQGPCPSSNCTSGDIRITKVELLQSNGSALPSTCTAGNNIQVMLRVTFDVTSATRYGFLVNATILINNSPAGTIATCDPSTFTQGLHTMDVSSYVNGNPIYWPCGSTIQLKDVYTAWDQQAPSQSHPGICTYMNPSTGAITNCSTIAPKCKLYDDSDPLFISAPLIASFTSQEGSCSNLKRSWTFTSTTTGGITPYTYTWNFGDGSPALVTTQNPVTHEYAYGVSGSVNVTLSVEDASTPTHQISTTQPQSISVTSCCIASTAPTGASAVQSSICNGGNTNISVTGGSLGTGASWKWYAGGCGSGSPIGTGATINVSPSQTTTYYVRAEGDCGTTSCASVTVIVKTPSADPTNATAVSSSICPGGNTDISVVGGSLGTGASWKWYAGGCGSGTSVGTGATITVSPSQTTTYYVRAEGDCGNTICKQVTVTVKSVSTTPTASAAASPICIGSSSTLNVTGGTLGTGASWVWYAGGCASGSSIGSGASINVSPSQTTTYYVRAEGDCGNTSCATVQVIVNAATVGGTLSPNRTICSGSNSGLLSLSGNVGSVVRWESSTTSGVAGFSTISNTAGLTSYTSGALTQDTWFRVIIKSGVCNEATSSVIKITVQQPISNNTIAASQVICSGFVPAAFTGSTPSGGDGSYSYQWQSRTGGGWSDISNATNKDYAPGAISTQTEFRRIVTSGTACSGGTSNTVTISISPESQVFAIQGSNYCASNPNTGTVTLSGSYPGVSYQLKKTSDNTNVGNPIIGTGSSLVWNNLEAGSYYVYGTGSICNSQTASVNVLMFDCSVFYTLTQGYYGGKNGKSCYGNNPVNTIKYLLGNVDLVVGNVLFNSVTVPATNDGAMKLNQTLPGGGTATKLPTGNCIITTGCFTEPLYLTKQGRINNILLSQTLTLSLNVRFDNGKLLLFPIRNGYLTTQKMKGCAENAVLVETCESGTISSILMNPAVVTYLGSGATVADLLKLANDVLSGEKTPGVDGVPSYNDITSAVDCINKSFDEGRRFLDYFDEYQTCEMLFPAPIILQSSTTTARIADTGDQVAVTVNAYPNPFSDNVNFVVDSKTSGYATLEVYNMMGQKVKTVYQGNIMAGTQRFSLYLGTQQRANLFYVLRVGNEKVSGKLLYNGRN